MTSIFSVASDWHIEFLASAALATLYLNQRFGSSAQNRSYTTAQRYVTGFAVLATVHLIVYFTFAAGLLLFANQREMKGFSGLLLRSPSWMALVTMFALPRLGLSRADGAVWRFCKRLAGIVYLARKVRHACRPRNRQ